MKHLEIEDRKVYFQIWDTAGQENFRSLVPMFLRDAKIALLVYDITSMVGKITHAKSWGVLGQRISINTSMFFVRIRSYKWNKYTDRCDILGYRNILQESFLNLQAWQSDLLTAEPEVTVAVIGNKSDLKDYRKVEVRVSVQSR